MPWTPFSAETVALNCKLAEIPRENVTQQLTAIAEALHHAHAFGPSNMPYDEFQQSAADGTLDVDVRRAILRGPHLRAAARNRELAARERMPDVAAAHTRFAEQHDRDAAAIR